MEPNTKIVRMGIYSVQKVPVQIEEIFSRFDDCSYTLCYIIQLDAVLPKM